MSSKILVINADDLGFSADINSTIEEGHRAGHITNATFMVNGKDVEGGLEVIRRNPRLGVGLHLDLCPVIGFYERTYQEIRESLPSSEMQRKVADEVERQIRRFQGFGLEFTHMDSHRHFHALPEIFAVVVETAAAHGLRTIRLTKDWILPKTPSVYWTHEFLASATDLLRCLKVVFPDKFIYGANEYSAATFDGSLNELMVHVAYHDAYFHREYLRLSGEELWQGIQEAGIQVRSYRDVGVNGDAGHSNGRQGNE